MGQWAAKVAGIAGTLFLAGWLAAGSVAAASQLDRDKLVDAKVFDLRDRQVVALVLENRLDGEGVEQVQGLRLEPDYREIRSAGGLAIALANVQTEIRAMPPGSLLILEPAAPGQALFSLSGPEAARATVAAVNRKTVKGKDGVIRLRTYLVVNIPRGQQARIPTIALDPGHGDGDNGAVQNNIREKDINLDIALRLAALFESRGWNVALTRRTDTEPSLLERADLANILGADVFISVHHNSLPEEQLPRSREFGTTVLYNAAAVQPAKELAEITQDEIIAALGTQREVLQDRPRLVVLNSTWVPAILTEGVMLPNSGNAKLILDRLQRQRMAEAIVRSVETWRGGPVKPLAATDPAKPAATNQSQPELPAGAGNLAANIANRGRVAAEDGWVYYLSRNESLATLKEETLWRFRPDRFPSNQLVADVDVWDVQLAGGWLYYVNWSDGQSIYRSRPDGTEAVRLVDGPAQQVNLASDRIIYVRDRRIHSTLLAGGRGFRLLDDIAENVMVDGGWIYYANGSDNFRPYRVKLDGVGKTRLGDDSTLFMAVAGNWLYYSNLSDGQKLYRMKLDGSGRSLVAAERAGYVNTDGKYIYYTSTDQHHAVYRIRPDGSGRLKVAEGGLPAGPIGIAGGKLYYRGSFIDLKP